MNTTNKLRNTQSFGLMSTFILFFSVVLIPIWKHYREGQAEAIKLKNSSEN